MEVGDRTQVGQWSFVLMTYSWIVGQVLASSIHIASAEHLAKMIKKASDCREFIRPGLTELRLTSIEKAHAIEYDLPYQTGYRGGEKPMVRLPNHAKSFDTLEIADDAENPDLDWLCLDQNTEPLRW